MSVSKDNIPKPSCEQVIDILPEPFVVIDRNYRIVAANAGYRNRYSCSDDDIVGRHCYEVSHHSNKPCNEHGEHCPMEAVFGQGQATQVMHVHYDKHGKEEYVQLQATPITDAAGSVLYMGEYIYPVDQAQGENTLLVGRSPVMLRMVSMLQRVAPTPTTVLLLGESGVGKERVAHYIHQYSNRMTAPFVVVDCGTLGENLIESELFGHEKGAFTGASSRKKGLFEAANGGTLFIDEICELPLPLQTKLLRALETGTLRRIGGTEYIKVNVRVIAATNRDMQGMVERSEFRQDLYYRLSTFPVNVPPLREHKDDIPALAEHFLSQAENGDRYIPLSTEVIEALLNYDYPGNVRELRNVIERAAILACEDMIRPDHLVFEGPRVRDDGKRSGPTRHSELFDRRHGRLTDEQVIGALEHCNGHRARAAHQLGVSERTLYRYVQKLRTNA